MCYALGMKYTFLEPVSIQVWDLDGVVHAFTCAAGVVELGDEDIALLEQYAPGVATLYVSPPVPAPVAAPAPAPAVPSEV